MHSQTRFRKVSTKTLEDGRADTTFHVDQLYWFAEAMYPVSDSRRHVNDHAFSANEIRIQPWDIVICGNGQSWITVHRDRNGDITDILSYDTDDSVLVGKLHEKLEPVSRMPKFWTTTSPYMEGIVNDAHLDAKIPLYGIRRYDIYADNTGRMPPVSVVAEICKDDEKDRCDIFFNPFRGDPVKIAGWTGRDRKIRFYRTQI